MASRACETLLGYPREDLTGRPFSVIFVEEDRDQGLDLHELTIAQKVGFSEDDRWHLRREACASGPAASSPPCETMTACCWDLSSCCATAPT
ncbi:PAS domain S-box protein [Aquincola tertiaricarbonis]|uniref:PAS domain S-box protein n=1 Tax=Aquincola tertiaricarbonis TaxID=391953 RepID=UPI0012EECD81